MSWRDVPGYPGFSVNELGQVRGPKGRVLKPDTVCGGYQRVQLRRARHVMVHVLVALAFVGPRPDGYQVNHIDGDTANNAARNLEYLRHTDNMAHARAVLGRCGGSGDSRKLTSADVYLIRQLGLTAAQAAARLGISLRHAQRVLSGACWQGVEVAA